MAETSDGDGKPKDSEPARTPQFGPSTDKAGSSSDGLPSRKLSKKIANSLIDAADTVDGVAGDAADAAGNVLYDAAEAAGSVLGNVVDINKELNRMELVFKARAALRKKQFENIKNGKGAFNFHESAENAYGRASVELKTIDQLEVDEEIQAEMQEEAEIDNWGMRTLGVTGFQVKFTFIISFLVVLNAIAIGVETDVEEFENAEKVKKALLILENIFCASFLIEMTIRLLIMGKKYFYAPWLILDGLLVFIAILDTWILPLMPAGMGAAGVGNLAVLRIIRLLRLVRLVKLMRSCKDVWLLVVGLANGLMTLGYVFILMMIALYTCAIFCVQMIGKDPSFAADFAADSEEDDGEGSSFDGGHGSAYDAGHGSNRLLTEYWYIPAFDYSRRMARRLKIRQGGDTIDPEKYFGNIPRSMFTLWECLNDGCTADIVRPVVTKKPWMMLFFLAFVMLMIYGFLNILVGIFVDEATNSAKEIQDKVKREKELKQQHGDILDDTKTIYEVVTGPDCTRQFTHKNFMTWFSEDEIQEKLKELGFAEIDVTSLFGYLDADGDGVVSIPELVRNMRGLKSSLSHPTTLLTACSIRMCHRLQKLYMHLDKLHLTLLGGNARKKKAGSKLKLTLAKLNCQGGLMKLKQQSQGDIIDDHGPSPQLPQSLAEKETLKPSKRTYSRLQCYSGWFLDGRPVLLCFDPPEFEEMYLKEALNEKTLFWVRQSLITYMCIALVVIPVVEVNTGVPMQAWAIRYGYRIFSALLGITINSKIRHGNPAHCFRIVTFAICLQVACGPPFRLSRLCALTGEQYDARDSDVWGELVALIYCALLSGIPGRFMIPVLFVGCFVHVLCVAIVDNIILTLSLHVKTETRYTLPAFLLSCAMLGVFTCIQDRNHRLGFVMRNEIGKVAVLSHLPGDEVLHHSPKRSSSQEPPS